MDKKDLLDKILLFPEDVTPEENLEFKRLLLIDPEFHKEYLKQKRLIRQIGNAFKELDSELAVVVNDEVSFIPKNQEVTTTFYVSEAPEDKHIVVIREGDIIYEDTLTPESYSISMAADSGEEPTIDEPILVDHQETDQYERNIFTVPAEGKVIFQLKFK